MIFKEARLYPWLKIKDNVALGLKNKSVNEKNKIVSEYLELVGLKGIENSYPDQLSGGMAQRPREKISWQKIWHMLLVARFIMYLSMSIQTAET